MRPASTVASGNVTPSPAKLTDPFRSSTSSPSGQSITSPTTVTASATARRLSSTVRGSGVDLDVVVMAGAVRVPVSHGPNVWGYLLAMPSSLSSVDSSRCTPVVPTCLSLIVAPFLTTWANAIAWPRPIS